MNNKRKSQDDDDNHQYIPKFISDAPWYFQANHLDHQKKQKLFFSKNLSKKTKNDLYCSNCKSKNHTFIDCLYRPTSKKVNTIAEPDFEFEDQNLSYAEKHDRYRNYIPENNIDDNTQSTLTNNNILPSTLTDNNILPSTLTDNNEGNEEINDMSLIKLASKYKDKPYLSTIKDLRMREDVPKYLQKSIEDEPIDNNEFVKESNPNEIDESKIIFGSLTSTFGLQTTQTNTKNKIKKVDKNELSTELMLKYGDQKNYTFNKQIYGHTSIYGSFYSLDKQKWGYKCCKQLRKTDVCTAD